MKVLSAAASHFTGQMMSESTWIQAWVMVDHAVKEPANVNAITTAMGDEVPSNMNSTTSKAKNTY